MELKMGCRVATEGSAALSSRSRNDSRSTTAVAVPACKEPRHTQNTE